MITVKVNHDFSPRELTDLIAHIQKTLAGKERDKYGFAARYWSAVAYSMFQSVYFAYLIKSNHGRDELGQKWKDHAKSTKAYNRRDARKYLTLYDNRAVLHPMLKVRPTLTPYLNKKWGSKWWGLVAYGKLTREIAGGTVWDYFKAQGAKTLVQLTKNLKLPILVDTGRLQRSLFPSPLKGGQYVPNNKDQVFRYSKGVLTIGTKVPYAEHVDEDRPLWPNNTDIWEERAVEAGTQAVYEYIPIVLSRRR